MSKGLKGNCGEPGRAASFAQNSRTAKAGMFDGGTPPSGPKTEPVRLNGVPAPKAKGVSGKGSPAK
jgi:hypothetical protein